ncbi:cytochrome b-c1 complex subunit 1, mitochondrial [Monosporozyma unispora]|nr:Cytochrome b-c1 complex subunit 1, mitochondrial [Kazachstania unispora]
MLRAQCINKATRLSRGFATQIKHSKLNNGISIYTNPQSTTPNEITLLVENAGVTAETPYNNGVAHFWANYFQSDPSLNQLANKQGTTLSSNLQRDYQTFTVKGGDQVKDSLNFLQENILQNEKNHVETLSTLKDQVISKIINQEENKQDLAVVEHLYSTAYQNTPLALPLLGTVETVKELTRDDIQKFAQTKFNKTDNLSILVSGPQAQSHESVVEAVNNLQLTQNANVIDHVQEKSSFLGSEVRLRDDTLPYAWISIAVESEAITSPDRLTSEVASYIFGSYNAFEPRSRLQGIKLLDNLQEYQLCDNFNHFQLTNRDSGLWGMTTRTSNVGNIDDLIHFILKQWNRLSISITETELNRAKAQFKLALANKYSTNDNWADFLVNYQSQFKSLDEIYKHIDSITVKDLKHWANKRLWDQDIAIAGMGQIEGLLDYMRIRNDMSMMRW